MKCEFCGRPLMVVKCDMIDETYAEQTFVCTNRKCSIFAGNDLRSPNRIATKEKVKVN